MTKPHFTSEPQNKPSKICTFQIEVRQITHHYDTVKQKSYCYWQGQGKFTYSSIKISKAKRQDSRAAVLLNYQIFWI